MGICLIYSATGYTIESTMKKIQDEDTEHIYRGGASVSSISDAGNKMNKFKYNYRDEVTFLRPCKKCWMND